MLLKSHLSRLRCWLLLLSVQNPVQRSSRARSVSQVDAHLSAHLGGNVPRHIMHAAPAEISKSDLQVRVTRELTTRMDTDLGG